MSLRPFLPALPLLSPIFVGGQEALDNLAGLPDSVITGKAANTIGEAPSASAGQANNEELSQRPVLRRGELLEVIPGLDRKSVV